MLVYGKSRFQSLYNLVTIRSKIKMLGGSWRVHSWSCESLIRSGDKKNTQDPYPTKGWPLTKNGYYRHLYSVIEEQVEKSNTTKCTYTYVERRREK